jgi:hypothetical protein
VGERKQQCVQKRIGIGNARNSINSNVLAIVESLGLITHAVEALHAQ